MKVHNVTINTDHAWSIKRQNAYYSFGTGDEFGSGHRKQVSEFGGVEKPGGLEDQMAAAVAVGQADGADLVAVDFRRHRTVVELEHDLAVAKAGREHFAEGGEGDTGFVGEAGDEAVAGVQVFIVARFGG